MPYNDYYEYFGPDYRLDVKASNMENMNTPEYLEKIKWVLYCLSTWLYMMTYDLHNYRLQVFENLSRTAFAPSVQIQG